LFIIHCRYYARRRPTQSSYRSVAVRGAHGYQLQSAPPSIDNCLTSGSAKHKTTSDDDYDARRRHRDSDVMSRDSCSLFYGDNGAVDRDGYMHIWERPLPGAPPPLSSDHLTPAAAMLVPAGQSGGCSSSWCSDSLMVYKCRDAWSTQQRPPLVSPLPLPLPALDVTPQSSSCQNAIVASVADLSHYYQLDAKDDDQSPPLTE